MPMTKLREFLDANDVKYVTISHSQAYTTLEIAAFAHIKGREIAKTVVLNLDGKLAMAVLPGTQKVDLERLRQGCGAASVELASEGTFLGAFPGCELGGMPPFGNLFGMEVFVDPRLAVDAEIAFNAGSHTELLRMGYADFERLVKPRPLPM